MFAEELQKRLDMLNADLVHISDKELCMTEKSKAGAANLTLKLKNQSILFEDLEHKKLQYFCNQKCADYIMYENVNGQWKLHVFELKRTVSKGSWSDMKLQFMGAIQNALAIAGFLGIYIAIEDVQVYSVYRNDKINDYVNPVRLREQMHQQQTGEPEACDDWNDGTIVLEFGGEVRTLHKKIKLDVETGNGIYAMA